MELISGRMSCDSKITLPDELREKLNSKEGDNLQFIIGNSAL
ncbi:AbrB/MazE/SpoVT family DNA-binding domain-containing protein [Bacillus sp. JJ1562]